MTEAYARKYFGREDPMGKALRIEQDTNYYTVTGVMEDVPVNSHIQFKMLGSLSTLRNSRSTNWVNHNFHTYFILAPGTDPLAFEARMQNMVEKYVGPLVEQFMGIDLEQFRESGNSYGYRLQAMTDIHLHSDLEYEMEPGGNPLYVYIFLVIAIVLVYLLLPAYNNLIRLDLDFDLFTSTWTLPSLILFAIFVGILAGSYPAFVLAGFKPAAVFKTESKSGSSKRFLRNLLTILQFTVTLVILLGTAMARGRFFSPEMPTDSFAVIVNQAAVKAFGIEDPLNTRFYWPGENGEPDEFVPIIGVVKDFHFESMHKEINPVAIHFMPGNWEGVLVLKLGDGNRQETIEFVRQQWEEFGVEHPFEYAWMDDTFHKLFDAERRTGQILVVFSILSIFISCLGLLGLISYSTSQRTKEIGIRKTMGASVSLVMILLSKETLRLLGISALLSIPAYFGVRAWLRNFAYHIEFNAMVYALTLLGVTMVVLLIALLTVSYNAYQAATANPAESLRIE